MAMRSNLSRLRNNTDSSRGATVSESSMDSPDTLWACTPYINAREMGEWRIGTRDSLFTEEHERLNTYNGITPNVFIIELLASPHVQHKYLELIPVYVVVQFARFRQALNLELRRRNTRRAGTANAKRPLYGGHGPTREMVNDGGDGCARWTRTEVDGEDGERLGARTGRVVIGLMGTDGPLRDLAIQAAWVCVGIEDGSSIID